MFRSVVGVLLILILSGPVLAQGKPYRLPGVDLKQPIIWGSTCQGPDGVTLGFGGQDQESDDG